MVGTVRFFNGSCTAVGPGCPVEDSVYGYHPNLGINVFLLSSFACFAVIHICLGIWKRTHFFAYLLTFSCIGEVAGYAGRVMLYYNPYDDVGFSLAISCLSFAPSFLAAAIHATLKHITLTFGATTSILPPPMYTWMFIAMDMFVLTVLAIGGALAGDIRNAPEHGKAGYILIVSGIVAQILTLVTFAGLVVDYLYRTRRAWHNVPFAATKLLDTLKFKLYVAGVAVAYVCVLVRCGYLLLELVGGWPNAAMHSQAAFVVFESCMIFLATTAFTVLHPGFCFALDAAPRSQRRTWRMTWTRPTIEESRDGFEMWQCRGTSSHVNVASPEPVELPSPTDTRSFATRQNSRVVTLKAITSQGSLAHAPTETWYSIDSDGEQQEPSRASASKSRESSTETWCSDSTLKEAEVHTSNVFRKPH